jgi:hypothetical protein
MLNLLYALLRRRSIFFYLLFLGYAIFINPWLIELINETSDGQEMPALGLFLFFVLLLELWGLWLKHPIMVYYARQYPAAGAKPEKDFGWVDASAGCAPGLLITLFIPVFHLAMAGFLYMIAVQTTGVRDNGTDWRVLLVVGGLFLVIIKEAGVMGLLYTPYGLRGASKDTYPTLGWRGIRYVQYPSEIRLEHLLRDALGDLVLLLFSAVAYSALWDAVALVSPLRRGTLTEYLGLGIYFMMVVLPLQTVPIFQTMTTQQTKAQRNWIVVSLLILVLVSMLTFFRV